LKKSTLKAIFFIMLLYLLPLSLLFSQTAFDEKLQNFADEINPSLPFAASMGLNWSIPYVGQLLGHPSHFGIGVALSSVFMSNAEPAELGEQLGIEIESSMIDNKQWFPSYVVVGRLGGFGGIPFDFGFKIGYLPDIAMWGPLDYNVLIFGFDVNYALFVSNQTGPVVAVGLGYDMLEGGVTGTMTVVPAGMTNVIVDTPARILWKSSTIKAKVLFAQPIMLTGISILSGLDLGYSMNKVGVNIGDNKNSPDFEDTREVSTISISGYIGFGLEFNAWHLDMNLMASFITFELGFNIGFRYQL
jgi:hypothetical protein